MSSIDTGGGEAKKGKPKKMNLRVDFTPMVDMNMLLITFFMFCTTLSKPQVMELAMPTDTPVDKTEQTKVKESKSISIILGAKNKVYYYEGLPKYNDYTSLKETTFAAENGIRDVLLKRNAVIVQRIKELKHKKFVTEKKMTDEQYNEAAKKIKSDKLNDQVVIIKATSEATYKNLVDVLDEMAICSIDKYVVVKMEEGDQYLLENLETKGAYGASAAAPKKK